MDGSFAALALRMVFSLAVVVGLLVLAARFARRQGLAGVRPSADWAKVEVLSRQALGRSSMLAVVRVTGRVMLLGVTEGGVELLGELEPGQDTPAEPPARPKGLLEALRERTVRHG